MYVGKTAESKTSLINLLNNYFGANTSKRNGPVAFFNYTSESGKFSFYEDTIYENRGHGNTNGDEGINVDCDGMTLTKCKRIAKVLSHPERTLAPTSYPTLFPSTVPSKTSNVVSILTNTTQSKNDNILHRQCGDNDDAGDEEKFEYDGETWGCIKLRNHGTKREGDVASLCESTEKARILCPITCNSCQSLPSFSPSITVSPSSSHSMYECVDDVENESIFEYSGKWYGCESLSKRKKESIKEICKKSNDLRKLCLVTCDSCPSLAPSSPPCKSLFLSILYTPSFISPTVPSIYPSTVPSMKPSSSN